MKKQQRFWLEQDIFSNRPKPYTLKIIWKHKPIKLLLNSDKEKTSAFLSAKMKELGSYASLKDVLYIFALNLFFNCCRMLCLNDLNFLHLFKYLHMPHTTFGGQNSHFLAIEFKNESSIIEKLALAQLPNDLLFNQLNPMKLPTTPVNSLVVNIL